MVCQTGAFPCGLTSCRALRYTLQYEAKGHDTLEHQKHRSHMAGATDAGKGAWPWWRVSVCVRGRIVHAGGNQGVQTRSVSMPGRAIEERSPPAPPPTLSAAQSCCAPRGPTCRMPPRPGT